MSEKEQIEKLFQELNTMIFQPSFMDFIFGPDTQRVVKCIYLLIGFLIDKKVLDLKDLEQLLEYMKKSP